MQNHKELSVNSSKIGPVPNSLGKNSRRRNMLRDVGAVFAWRF